MKIEIRNDRAVVSGYVNAVGRDSRPITDKDGKLFVEQIEPGAFRASLERSGNVDLLLNHNRSRVYASTKDGSLKLTEDSIGLRAEAVLTDAEMICKARAGEFRGWSFGMYVGDSTKEERAEGIPRRHVKSLNMFEVSLIDKSRIPCYVGTSVECRADGEILAELRYSEEEPEIIEEERSEPVDYSAVDDVISELRYGAVDNVIAELRYNPYHDPSNGRFTSGGGSGGGFSNKVTVYVEKGQKGNKQYIVKGNDGNYYKYDNRSDVGEDYGIEIDLKYAQEMAHKFGSAKYGGTQKTRELFEKYNNEAKSLSAELAKLRKGRKGEMSMGGNLIWESSRAFDPIESKLEELRYNPYHDPSNGRFTSGGGGGGGGVLFVGKGQKGKGVYVVDVDHDEEYKKWKAEKQNGNDAFAELPEEPLYKYGTKDLPQLTGSAEEIKEAKKIRSKTLKDAQYYALTKLSDGRPSDLYKTASLGKQAMIDSINNSALVKAVWDPNVKQQKISDKVAGYKDTYARNQRFGDILSQTSAKFWLDHDTNTPKNYMNLHFKDYIDGKTKL